MFNEEDFDVLASTRSIPDSDARVLMRKPLDASSTGVVAERQLQPLNQQDSGELAVAVVDTMGAWLTEVDDLITQLEDSNDSRQLGSVVLRKCQEIADVIGDMANELEQQSNEEREMLAQACVQDLQTALVPPSSSSGRQAADLSVDAPTTGGNNEAASWSNHTGPSEEQWQQQQEQLLKLQPNDMQRLLQAATYLLRDVEEAFRSVDHGDASEIADVAVISARLFLISLQSAHHQLQGFVEHQQLGSNADRSSPRFEILEQGSQSDRATPAMDAARSQNGIDSSNDTNDASTNTNDSNANTKNTKNKKGKRIRILWPPLGPHVENAFRWGKENAMQKPLLTAALGITMWPVAFGTAVVGGGIVITDSILQNVYNHLHNSQAPILEHLESGAAQAWQTTRLSLLTGKLVAKQSIRVVQHQVERQGGWPEVGKKAAGMAVDRICHPVETIGMAWNATAWGAGMVSDAVQQIIAQQQQQQQPDYDRDGQQQDQKDLQQDQGPSTTAQEEALMAQQL